MTTRSGRPVRPAYTGLPPKRGPGMRVGLFGGSFDPPHEGHRLASLVALRRLQLDRIWWLVSPGNPLKDTSALPTQQARLTAASEIADHPAIDVTGIETVLGTRYTVDVLIALKQRCPGVQFVWIMGADNLRNFHRWQRWTTIVATMPIAIVDRPGSTLNAVNTRAGVFASRWHIREVDAPCLARRGAPAFVFLHGPRSPQSSTALRNRRHR